MKWEAGRRSDNVEDRRGARRGRGLKVGGTAGVVLVLGVVVYGVATGKDVSGILSLLSEPGGSAGPESPGEDQRADFVSVVLADTEDTWTPIFQARGERYAPPRLVLFRGQVDSACGMQSAATGPFYCPGDRQAYIDLSFFDELDQRFGAPGDFAQA
ncbi:MAG: neutral zinc metallopeptidase, partial [Myxococcales bacterium]|nr:neutral zinc metallopeptidase [Myxococcales bacterium]